jgi:hypothetical protein
MLKDWKLSLFEGNLGKMQRFYIPFPLHMQNMLKGFICKKKKHSKGEKSETEYLNVKGRKFAWS